jgi:hypothetical protein
MEPTALPACGLYRTTAPIHGIPAGRLVYFHNHGTPGPGLYVPTGWASNVARFSNNGTTVSDELMVRTLLPLPAQGFYRVAAPFHCCEKKCRLFESDLLVQLGYDGAGKPILFVPELGADGMRIPQQGQGVDDAQLRQLVPLKVAHAAPPAGTVRDVSVIH